MSDEKSPEAAARNGSPESRRNAVARRRFIKPFTLDGWENQEALDALSGTAESWAAFYERVATMRADDGDSEGAEVLRENAEVWRRLMDVPEEAAVEERRYDDLEQDAVEAIEMLLARSEKFDGGDLCLIGVLKVLLKGLHGLAAGGKKPLAKLFMTEIGEAVSRFEVLAGERPELFKEWAGYNFAIPGMISRNPERMKDAKDLAEKLEVGKSFHLKTLPTGNRGRGMSFRTPANLLAARLLGYLRECREKSSLALLIESIGGFEPLPFYTHSAFKLPDLSEETWKEWAEASWEILCEISPSGKPSNNPLLEGLNIRRSRTDPYFETTVSAPSVAENDLKEMLFNAVEMLATGTSRRTSERKKKVPRQKGN